MKLYKILGKNGTPCNGGHGKWHLPRRSRPGKWMPKLTDLEPCVRGYHLCNAAQISSFLNASSSELYEVEWQGGVIWVSDKAVVGQARLATRVGRLNDKVLRLFACDCSSHILPIFEKANEKDRRPRIAIAVARRFAMGKATQAELFAAWAAAWAAAQAAAQAAVRDAPPAARDAARAAARSAAARDAAWAAAGSAAESAAEAAALSAAGDAAEAAAARDAAGDAERTWQGQTLLLILKRYG